MHAGGQYRAGMAYTDDEAREDLLDELADATNDLARALAALGEAFEQLDDDSAERLEDQLFRPVQTAYGRAQRTYAGFANRHGLPPRTFEPAMPGLASAGVKGFVEEAVAAVEAADHGVAELQDSLKPVEVGDVELRAGLSEVRTLVGDVPARGRAFVSSFGR